MTATFENSATEHGSLSGYTLHGERHETPCSACSKVKREYDANRFANHPTKAERNRQNARARSRAMSRLADMHPAVFSALLAEEKAKEGLR